MNPLKSSLTLLSEQKLDRVLKDKQTMDKQRQDRLIASISQTLTTAVNTKLDKVVRSEMKNNVLPCEGGRGGQVLLCERGRDVPLCAGEGVWMNVLLCKGGRGRDECAAM